MQRKYLIVCFDNLGDLVMVSSLAETISRENLATSVSVWCKPYCASIARMFPSVKKVHTSDPPWDRKFPGSRERGSWMHFLKVLREVHAERYDVALIATRQWRFAMALRMGTSICDRRGLSDWKSRPWLTHFIPWDPKANHTSRFSTTLHQLLLPDLMRETTHVYARLELIPSIKDVAKKICDVLAKKNPDKKKILLNPFAGSLKRCWPLSEWIALGEKLRAHNAQLFWSGTPADRKKLENIVSHDEIAPDFSAIPGWNDLNDFEQSIALMMSVDLYVGHDSGPLHVASALGKTCIGLYLPSLYPRTLPHGASKAVIIHRASPSMLSFTDMYQTCLQTMEALPSAPND